ncbi:AMP-binding protein [Rhodococcus sp. NPDC056743]|uniref:AMP-binding protein n=1 Tax=Rhodococcus sp. NPDC056743 TaxID=3345934 RepID=UPI0036733766
MLEHGKGGRTPIGVALARLAAEAPDRPAITVGGTVLTRAELESRTNRLARAYLDMGARPGSFVTIALPNGVGFLESTLAVWKIGATPQPISHRLPARELDAIIELADPTLVVGMPAKAGYLSVPADFLPSDELSDSPLPDAIAPSLKAPTSGGSTGRPKLIVSTEEATTEALARFGALIRILPNSVLLSTGPLSHNGPLFSTAAALLTGCHVIVMERFDAQSALEAVGRHRVDWMYSVPTMLSRIAALPEAVRDAADLTSLRTVMTVAAHCPQALREFCLDYFGPDVMLELFAATEAHSLVIGDGHGWLARPGTVGRVVVGEIEVRDEAGNAVGPGQVGELWMRRSENEAGPYRYIGSTAQQSADGWETVGDLGRLDEEGYLYLADRKTDMIVVGGSNVYPAEVESALEEHPAVTAACVVGLPSTDYGQTIHAVLNVSAVVSDDELLAHLRERVVPYKFPRSIECVDYPLRDEAGKTQRSRVRQQVTSAAGSIA